MKYLLHSTLTFSAPSRAILYDEAEYLASNRNEVYVLYCNKALDLCFTNMSGDKRNCAFCVANYKFSDMLNVSSKINFLPLSDFLSEDILKKSQEVKFDYENINEIKKIKYDDVSIGLACLSSYVSYTRNLYPEMDQEFHRYFDVLLANSVLMCNLVSRIFEKVKPDHVYGYNGRFLDSRPLWEMAKNRNIPFSLLEAQYTFSYCNKIVFNNDTPHSIQSLNKNFIEEIWNNTNVDLNKKRELAIEFFERRKNALPAGDKVYTINQKIGLIPANWDRSKKNIVIYTSSEDEFVAIGDEFEKYSIFPNQLNGIEEIVRNFTNDDDLRFYLRIHPNLADVKFAYHRKLYELAKYNNLTIIEPKSDVSSYSLIDNADSIIVFGSTIGIEASYWGKPVILLGGAVYYFLESCYIPSSKEELYKMIKSDLNPKDKLGAYKFGLTYHDSTGVTCDRVDCNWEVYNLKIFGFTKKITLNNWEKLFGSRVLFFIMRAIAYLPLKLYCSIKNLKPKYQIPMDEQYL